MALVFTPHEISPIPATHGVRTVDKAAKSSSYPQVQDPIPCCIEQTSSRYAFDKFKLDVNVVFRVLIDLEYAGSFHVDDKVLWKSGYYKVENDPAQADAFDELSYAEFLITPL